MGFVGWLIGLVATALGTILGFLLVDSGLIGLAEVIPAIVWFLICFVTYYAGTRLKEEKWFRLLSVNFLLTWIFCDVGYLLGIIVWQLIKTGTVSMSGNQLLDAFLISLPLTIGPTATMSIGLRDN